MASVTGSERNDESDLALSWSGRWTLTHRILAVNILTLAIVALSILYLDAYRNQLQDEREARILGQARISALAIDRTPASADAALIAAIGRDSRSRLRVYDRLGELIEDSWATAPPTYVLRDPTTEAWGKDVARALDRGFNVLVGEKSPEDFIEPKKDIAGEWPEIGEARSTGKSSVAMRQAPDLTPVFSAATPLAGGSTLLVTANDRDFTRTVRSQRGALAIALSIATLLSVLLSLFLARTIVRPLRRIAIAAHRVRLGRAREVRVPRLPSRRDEIGMLARSVSDMSQSLRMRIDNIEAFAADVTHELKNPLASLRSAVDGLERIDDPKLRQQLLDVVRQDVMRLDRLIGDVGEAARTDAELARARFEPVDLGPLIEQLVSGWEQRRETGTVRLAFARPRRASTIVVGEPGRLARAIDNIIDNAISFSPADGLVEIAAIHVGDARAFVVDADQYLVADMDGGNFD